jgi:hypothetical protein
MERLSAELCKPSVRLEIAAGDSAACSNDIDFLRLPPLVAVRRDYHFRVPCRATFPAGSDRAYGLASAGGEMDARTSEQHREMRATVLSLWCHGRDQRGHDTEADSGLVVQR